MIYHSTRNSALTVSSGKLYAEGCLIQDGQEIHHIVCKDCSIVRSYVHYPEKLKYSRGAAMVKKIRDLKCPFCGGTEFVKGRSCSFGTHSASLLIVPLRVKLFDFRENTQPEIRVYCKNCGSLIREYIRNPEYLEP